MKYREKLNKLRNIEKNSKIYSQKFESTKQKCITFSFYEDKFLKGFLTLVYKC